MSNLVFAILSVDQGSATDYQHTMRELTLAWTKYRHQEELIEGTCVDSAISQAAAKNAGFCLLQTSGHIIDERWYLPHWDTSGFYQSIDNKMLDANFLLSADWEVEERATDAPRINLRSDCMLVNLDQYRALGCPSFESASVRQGLINCNIQDSAIVNARHQQTKAELGVGGNWLKISLEHDLPIKALGDNINQCRFNLTESANSENVLSKAIGKPIRPIAIETDNPAPHTQFIKKISNQITSAKNGIFLFNIESYVDLETTSRKEPLDALFSVAAGFKPYRILLEKGFTDDTEVVFYDYSQAALDVKKFMIENWNGLDFPKFVRVLFQKFPHPDVFYQLWDNTTPLNINLRDMEIMWQNELEKWGGERCFEEHWKRCKSLRHSYIHCDLLADRKPLLAKMSQSKNNYIWWSNAFFTIFSHWHFNASVRKQQYLAWINAIAETSPECEISGADHNNSAVNGLTAKQYSARLDRTVCDQLRPQNLHTKRMQF